jgi:hypothetical protein
MEKPAVFSLPELSMSTRLSPQERLAASRKALLRHMSRDAQTDQQDTLGTVDSQMPPQGPEHESTQESSSSERSSGTLYLLKRGLRTWWSHHPANFALSVARPLLGRYASRSPFRMLAISAGVGAALVLVKPWRLVSIGGMALATLKSSEFSGLLMSVLSSQADEEDPSA